MAYRNDGVWESDRETRRRTEQMWTDHKGKGKGKGHGAEHNSPPGGRKDDDLTRAMASDLDDDRKVTHGGGGTLGLKNYLGTTGAATKLDRPIIPGGCHHNGQTVSITLTDGKRLYGAMGASITKAAHLGLVIDCAGHYKAPQKFVKGSAPGRFKGLNVLAGPDVVNLAWPDMTAPSHVGYRFWARLRDLLPDDTAVCCMGGHGRTGTALAALLVADGEDPDVAIKRVRTEHCKRAIETSQQEGYIRALARERDAMAPAKGPRENKADKGKY